MHRCTRDMSNGWLVMVVYITTLINEKVTHFNIFKKNMAFIESSNKDANKPYKLSVNQFADLINEEFKASRNGFKGHECSMKTSFKYENVTTSLPATMDWRKKGAVTPPWKYMCLSLILMLGAWSSGATSRTLQDASMYGRYEQWLTRYGRVYNDVNEKETRFKIFKENVAFIESSNKDANKPYRLSVNQFADLTNEEFKASRNGFKGHECSTKTSFKYENLTASLPATMDWRKKGAVTPIKDQGQCAN
ncbi:unnamed protein product [Malus baccata var. baccata]